MTNNVKTPVMVLQELAAKKHFETPEYIVVSKEQGTPKNEFRYHVKVSATAVGTGFSKQQAKHDAAQKAIDKLQSAGISTSEESDVKSPRSELPGSPKITTINYIGTLRELCVNNKIPMPTFIEISDVGPPHCKAFTYECSLTSLVTSSTAGTKKQAKQLAAKEMLDRMAQVQSELTEERKNNNVDQDTKAAETYSEIKKMEKTYRDLNEHSQEETVQ